MSPTTGHTNRAVIVWCDDGLLRSKTGHRTPVNPDDVEVDEVLAAALRRDREDGRLVLGLSWQPEIAAGTRTAVEVDDVFERMNVLLIVDSHGSWASHTGPFRPLSPFPRSRLYCA